MFSFSKDYAPEENPETAETAENINVKENANDEYNNNYSEISQPLTNFVDDSLNDWNNYWAKNYE